MCCLLSRLAALRRPSIDRPRIRADGRPSLPPAAPSQRGLLILHQVRHTRGKSLSLRKSKCNAGFGHVVRLRGGTGRSRGEVTTRAPEEEGTMRGRATRRQLLRSGAAQIGGKRLAAPPAGATDVSLDLLKVAERYLALLELGAGFGVAPQVEIWGFSRTLRRLGEAALVAIESGHPLACLLPDVYHLYRGGSDFSGLKLLSGAAIHVIHVNDYPASPPREKITDADRVYPGDGVAPLAALFRDLAGIGFRGALSLELFNRDYWKQDALTVARTGLAKTRAVVRRSLEG